MATATGKESAPQSSLLPYLHKGQGVRLSLLSGTSEQLKSAYPFSVVQDSHPFARLLTADFVTDAGSMVRRMFMLVQRDAYRSSEDELFPLANTDLEQCWQETSRLIGSESGEGGGIFLSGQIGEEGKLQALSPLFFCRSRKTFFHPPCPDCGTPLQLCRDDDLLKKHGLGSWSRSLKRYLTCPACLLDTDPRFFAYELEPNDPPFVMDRWGLIREFGRLHENLDPDNPFPCINCTQWGSCYGQGQASQSRIVPFSFYPFQMLLCEAASFHSMDFLALLSGASLDELTVELEARGEPGRISCLANWGAQMKTSGFLYPCEDEAHFLELLYLKFSLLLDAFRKTIPSASGQIPLQLGPRIVGLWVDLPCPAGALPSLWSFRTRFVDLLKPEPELPYMGSSQQGASPFYLGLFWFQALARNRIRSGREIVNQAKTMAKEMAKGGGAISDEELLRLFPPGDTFWNPDSSAVPLKFHSHWKSLIRLGAELVEAGISGRNDFPDYGFFQRAESVRERLRSDLTGAGNESKPVTTPVQLKQIVMDIHNKWKAESTPNAKEAGITVQPRPDSDLVETVMLSPAALNPEPSPETRDYEICETVILTPADTLKSPSASWARPEGTEMAAPQADTISDSDEEVDLEATVILPKGVERGRPRRGSS